MKINPKIIYSPDYDIHFWGIEKLHPFDTRKYSHAYDLAYITLGNQLQKATLTPTHPVSDDDLCLVHTRAYLESLKSVAILIQALEFAPLAAFPYEVIEERVLTPMRLATSGTIMAAREVLSCGLAINLSGGYHHASADKGEGFTVFSDMSIAILKLRAEGKLSAKDKILLIDLDAHQGNGHERVFHDDPLVYIFDMYNGSIYPHDSFARKRINWNLSLAPGTRDTQYLNALKDYLPRVLNEVNGVPKMAFYIAGTDIYEHDQLGGLRITENGIFERDRFVLDTLMDAQIPTVMLLAGGYSHDSYRFISRSICYALGTWGNS
ncbi:MAG: histone deacetylase [Anaerolineae bacterium]